MAWRGALGAGALGGAGLLLWAAAMPPPVHPGPAVEIVATGVHRPLQLVLEGRSLIVLGLSSYGDSAAELYRVDLGGRLPVDLSGQPRLRIPFAETRPASLGSLALHPETRQLFLGEENGARIYRLSPDGRLAVYAVGLHRLAGGSTLAFDGRGRLLIVDYMDRALSPGEDRKAPALEPFPGEEYRGPLVFRLALDDAIPLPRRLDDVPPFYPRAWAKGQGALLPRFISLAPLAGGDVALLSSAGEVFRLAADGRLEWLARLPPGHGQYNRINMVGAPDGSLYVSGGFHVARIFRVSPDGAVATVASNLADPEGIALDPAGYLYVAESSFHRIVRFKPAAD